MQLQKLHQELLVVGSHILPLDFSAQKKLHQEAYGFHVLSQKLQLPVHIPGFQWANSYREPPSAKENIPWTKSLLWENRLVNLSMISSTQLTK